MRSRMSRIFRTRTAKRRMRCIRMTMRMMRREVLFKYVLQNS